MNFLQCRFCGFWLQTTERICPNCGHRDPLKPFGPFWKIFLVFLNLSIFLIIFLFTLISPVYKVNPLTFFITLCSVSSVLFIIGSILDKQMKKEKITAKNYLKSDETNIHSRIQEITSRNEKLNIVRNNIKEGKKTDKMKSMSLLIDNAEQLLMKYRGRYEVELWKIEIIRWKNSLEPIEAEWTKLDYQGCIKRMEALKKAIQAGEQLKTTYTENTLSKTPDGKAALKSLKQALAVCDRFYEGLTARQAKLAINDVSPVDETAAKQEVAQNQETHENLFNAKSDVTSFITAFEELEGEFDRIEAEDKLSL
ncbi:MAG: hypothetical protein JW904_13165 [Spirochaetales bacterium]|nr:hypothetical protein [Spirochaetales bacterium]